MRPGFKNIAGQKFTRLLVLQLSKRATKDGKVLWDCRCDCGTELMVMGKNLRAGTSRSCGCLRKEMSSRTKGRDPITMINHRFGRLTVTGRSDRFCSEGHIYWVCRCDCGTPNHTVRGNSLRSGASTSCGCVRREKSAISIQRICSEAKKGKERRGVVSLPPGERDDSGGLRNPGPGTEGEGIGGAQAG